MGDTTNWEFAAVVAAVVMGLGGLLVFTLIAVVGSWRVFRLSLQSAREAGDAAVAVHDLARSLEAQRLTPAPQPPAPIASDLSELRQQADALLEQQARLRDATRRLVESRALGGDDASQGIVELEAAVRRLDDNMSRVAAAVANLGARMT